MKFLLQLGRLPILSLYETRQLFPTHASVTEIDEQYALVETKQKDQFLTQIQKSAGSIKALEVLDVIVPSQLAQSIATDLESTGKTNFGVFFHNHPKQKDIYQTIKDLLKQKGLSARYREGTAEGLSAAILLHKQLSEYGVFQINNQSLLAKTIWVQHIDHWSVKDIEKPKRDPDKGMMPPKLARMMINFLSPKLREKPVRLLDPFCGTGTILMESLELGYQTIGSDLSTQAVVHAGENLRWFTQTFSLTQDYSLSTLDATQIQPQQIGGKVDAIVTEPFLGKQQPKPDQLPGMFKGLEKQYLGILKRWVSVLNPGGEVVLITPLVDTGSKQFNLAKIIDKSREFGYSILSGPLVYTRGHTIVKRAIYHLKLTT